VITHAFTHAAQQRAQALGLPAHPIVVVEHPLARKTRDQAQHLARHSLEAVVHGLVAHQEEPGRASPVRPPPRRARASHLQVSGTVSAMNDYLYDQGWTDGLPVIPPTPDLVAAMLEAAPLPAEEVLGTLPPRDGTVTVEKVASNAVMAGCQPAYFPVVLAAVKAVLQPQFNAGAITTTTGGAAPVVIISGPIAQQLGIHSGTAVLGSGHRPNATIGRALRLTMRNLGGATADTMEKSTHGWPGKYTMCFAENAARNPWEPLHVELGFAPEVSIVVVVAARGLITIVESSQETGLGNLETLASAMRGEGISGYYYQARGASPIVVLGPEHAAEIATAGVGRHAVKEYVFQHARMPLGHLRDRGHWGARSWPEAWEHQPDDFPVPLVTDPDKLIVVVAGGDGRHSSWFPAWSATQRAMEVIEAPPERGPRAGAPSPCG
jgi:hypothetical protein